MTVERNSRLSATSTTTKHAVPFQGFELPIANFIYCPNQFFDLCLSHHSRNVVRLVGFLLDQTLGWLDRDGQPLAQQISVTYRDLISAAGISRGAIRSAVNEAIAAGFITCTERGQPKSAGHPAITARYSLRWGSQTEYVTEPDKFQGFYAGEGYRTPIPNAFFRRVLRQETLAVVKVVGTVLRHTVGYQNQFGGRRSEAPLSYRFIQQYASMGDRTTLADAIQYALQSGYIRRVSAGVFSPQVKKQKPAAYAVNWLTGAETEPIGSKNRPEASKRFKNQTSNGSESRPADRFKIPTKEKTELKDIHKQQEAAVAYENSNAMKLLIETGFDERVARELSASREFKDIERQIDWLRYRNPAKNKLGLLRRAIEENWSEPHEEVLLRKRREQIQKAKAITVRDQTSEERVSQWKREQRRQRESLLPTWEKLPRAEQISIEQAAFTRLPSDFERQRFQTHDEFRLRKCLDELLRHQTLPSHSIPARR